jgi:hypothetical protein
MAMSKDLTYNVVVPERSEGIVGSLDFTKVPLMITLGAFETSGKTWPIADGLVWVELAAKADVQK